MYIPKLPLLLLAAYGPLWLAWSSVPPSVHGRFGTSGSASPGEPVQDRTDAEKAETLLNKAIYAYKRGRYGEAVKKYRLTAKKYPGTEAGRIAGQRARPNAVLGTKTIVASGPSDNRVDVALMGDGFTLKHQEAFDKLAADIPAVFHNQRTFREYASYFNFHTFHIVSFDDNVDGYGRDEDTALGGLTLGTIQGHVGIDPSQVKRALEELPENDDLAIVFVRVGILGHATPGIAAIGGRDAVFTIHEWGHAFGNLGDEYSTRTHERGVVREMVNVSNHSDPDLVPWSHWIEAGSRGVGVYQGANGQVRGAWKPTASGCVMLDGEFFCQPCREALVLQIYALVDPIDGTNHPPYPFEHPASLEIEDGFTFKVRVMTPERHKLEVRWWIIPEKLAPEAPKAPDPRYYPKLGNRSDRGPLPQIFEKPAAVTRADKDSMHSFRVTAKGLEPGRYRVICRAKDTTTFRGKKLPWVLKDEFGLLESQRAWWIRIPGPTAEDSQ